jgi:hypothetical protein
LWFIEITPVKISYNLSAPLLSLRAVKISYNLSAPLLSLRAPKPTRAGRLNRLALDPCTPMHPHDMLLSDKKHGQNTPLQSAAAEQSMDGTHHCSLQQQNRAQQSTPPMGNIEEGERAAEGWTKVGMCNDSREWISESRRFAGRGASHGRSYRPRGNSKP